MSTKIEWVTETWNAVTGCTPVSEACEHCYAERLARRFPAIHGQDWNVPKFHSDRLEMPLHWRKPRKIFVCSMSDLFHEDVPNEWIHDVFEVMATTPQHRYFILTKRPERMRKWVTGWAESCGSGGTLALPNVALGVSVENQPRANERIPALLQAPAAMRFVSVEPCLLPVSLALMRLGRLDALAGDAKTRTGEIYAGGHGLDWVIAGCESGPGRRTTCLDWFRTLRDECIHSNVPFFLKQMDVGGKLRHMPRLDGRVWDQWPEGW